MPFNNMFGGGGGQFGGSPYNNPQMGGRPMGPQMGGPPGQGMPQPMSKSPGPGGGQPPQGGGMQVNPMQMMQFQRQGPGLEQRIDEMRQQLMQAQMMGANPMEIGQLQMQLQVAERELFQGRRQEYARGMGDLTRQDIGTSIGTGGRGGRGGSSQIDRNPYLQMLLQSQLGMGNPGGAGGGFGGQ